VIKILMFGPQPLVGEGSGLRLQEAGDKAARMLNVVYVAKMLKKVVAAVGRSQRPLVRAAAQPAFDAHIALGKYGEAGVDKAEQVPNQINRFYSVCPGEMSGVVVPGGKGWGRAEDAGLNGVLLAGVRHQHVLTREL
jgi:hypothetical protein